MTAFDRAWGLAKMPYKVRRTDRMGIDQNQGTTDHELDSLSGQIYSGSSVSDPDTQYFIDNPHQALSYAVFGSALPRTDRKGLPFRLAPMRETVPRMRRLDLSKVPFNEEALLINPSINHQEHQIPKEWEQFVEDVPKEELLGMLDEELADWFHEGYRDDEQYDDVIDRNKVFGQTSARHHRFIDALNHMKEARERLKTGQEGNLTIPKEDTYHYGTSMTDPIYEDDHFSNALLLLESALQGKQTPNVGDAWRHARGLGE